MPDNPDAIGERVDEMDQFWLDTARTTVKESVSSLEEAAKQLIGDPIKLLELLNSGVEPQHSEREEPPEEVPAESRRTQPVHDYLAPEEGDSSWRL